MSDETPRSEPLLTCEFVPPHEPWECRVHRGIRTSLDEPQCDAIRPAKPLTPGQLDNLRAFDAEGRVPHNRYVVRGLLATLDAERSRQEPAPLDVEWFVTEVVAYYKLYDHHDVWRESGARALGEWLRVRALAAALAEPES